MTPNPKDTASPKVRVVLITATHFYHYVDLVVEAWDGAPEDAGGQRSNLRGMAGPCHEGSTSDQDGQIWNSDTCPAGQPVFAVTFTRK
jgi:hypothetical protein